MITQVDERSPAYEADLRHDDLITHVHGEPVQNLTHPQLMHRILSFGNELALKVTPLAKTTIKEGAARRCAGKLAKKKPKRPQQRRVPLEKKSRKPSSLLRRLSGKRPPNETIVPGTSSQKQTFMPRSVSSQDGMTSNNATTTPSSCTSSSGLLPSSAMHVPTMAAAYHKRLSDVGLRTDDSIPTTTMSLTSPLAALPLPPPAPTAIVASSAPSPPTSPPVITASTSSIASSSSTTASTHRPSTLQGLKHKVVGMAQHLAPRKHSTAVPMPVSPLARHENVTPTLSMSPARSPSPTVDETIESTPITKHL